MLIKISCKKLTMQCLNFKHLKGGFSRSYCCYGNLLCHKNDDVFSNDWAVSLYHDCSIE